MRIRFLLVAFGLLGCFFVLDFALERTLRDSPTRHRSAKDWLEALQDTTDASSRLRAADELPKYGPRVAPAIAQCLKHPSIPVRNSACVTLTWMGPSARAAVPELIEVMQQQTGVTKIFAIEALESIGPGAAQAVDSLTESACDPNPVVRYASIEALGALGETAIPALVVFTRDQDPVIQRYAVDALAKCGASTAETFAAVRELIDSDQAEVRTAALFAMASQGERGLEYLRGLLASDDPSVRRNGAMILCRMGENAEPAANQLLAALSDPDATVRFWALRGLAEVTLDGDEVRDRIADALADPDADADVRWQATQTLAQHSAGRS